MRKHVAKHANIKMLHLYMLSSKKKYIENMQSMCNYKSILMQEIYGRHINEGNAIIAFFCQKIHCMNVEARQLEI